MCCAAAASCHAVRVQMQEMQHAQVADAEDPRAPTPNTMQLAEDCSSARCAPVPPAVVPREVVTRLVPSPTNSCSPLQAPNPYPQCFTMVHARRHTIESAIDPAPWALFTAPETAGSNKKINFSWTLLQHTWMANDYKLKRCVISRVWWAIQGACCAVPIR